MDRTLPQVLLSLLVSATLGWAQTGTGNIQGTIQDATGAVLPAAGVTITHIQTSRQYHTTSTEVGFYLFPSVQVGLYEITAEAPGMEPWGGELTLQVGQTAEVNPTLQIATADIKVSVVGDITPLVTTTNPTLANVVERTRIEQLPVDGRFIQHLLYLTTPGLESPDRPRDDGVPRSGVPSVFGLRNAVELLQDGAVLMNRQMQSIPQRPPGLDSIQEFRVETSNSSAKMNRPGTVILTTRAGTNNFHGSVFETARNSAIGMARKREDGPKAPHLVRNEFGGSVGGPIYIPKLYNGRSRTFFFFAYEGLRLRQSSTRGISMPTAAMREGDFSGLVDAEGRKWTLYDPMTTDADGMRQEFLNNQIPINRRSPLATHLYSITPLPTNLKVNPLVSANWFGLGFNDRNQTTITTRVDHRLSERDQLFFRYSHNAAHRWYTQSLGENLATGLGSPTTMDGKANATTDGGKNDSGVVSWTHMFSPTFFGETIFGVQRDNRNTEPAVFEDIATQLGLSNPFKGLGFPRIQTTGFGMNYDSFGNRNIDFSRIYNLDLNFTKLRGRHQLQFGARWRYESVDILPDQQETMGSVSFDSLGTALYNPSPGSNYNAHNLTGHIAANLFLGVATYAARYYPGFFRLRGGENAAYFQDNFKVNSRLTLNLGLRYEYSRPARDLDKTILGFNPKTHAIVMGRSLDDLVKLNHAHPAIAKAYTNLGVKFESPAQAGLPDNMMYSNRWDFGPRIGFAYRIGESSRPTVLRGGYAIYAIPDRLRTITEMIRNIVPTSANVTNNPNDAQQSPDGQRNYLLRSQPRVIAGRDSRDVLDLATVRGITRTTGMVYYFDPHQPTTRAHEWNITLEREILANTSVSLSYVGTDGVRLPQYYSYNEAPNAYIRLTTTGERLPAVIPRNFDNEVFGTIQRYQKTGRSNNNSFVAEVQHRFSNGYAFQVFYTLSSALRADDTLLETNLYLPGAVPSDQKERNQFLNYKRDMGIPRHRVNWNWILDLPFGRGKPLGRNVRGFVNGLIGGWQIAGNGALASQYFALPTSMWGPIGKVEVYGKKYRIQDCTSGECRDGYLYYNGYISPNLINKASGITGVPSNYRPSTQPLIPWDATTPPANFPVNGRLEDFRGTNTVWVPLKDGLAQQTTFNDNLHPFRNQFILGPMIWSMNASIFKSVQLTETVSLRFNIDFFNVLNMPGTNLPTSGTGIISTQNSVNFPRTLQLTARLNW